MREDRQVGEHLVVDELVPLRRLHHAIQREHAPEAAVLEQLQALMLGLAVVDDLVGLQRQPEMRMQDLLYPAAHRPLPRSEERRVGEADGSTCRTRWWQDR